MPEKKVFAPHRKMAWWSLLRALGAVAVLLWGAEARGWSQDGRVLDTIVRSTPPARGAPCRAMVTVSSKAVRFRVRAPLPRPLPR